MSLLSRQPVSHARTLQTVSLGPSSIGLGKRSTEDILQRVEKTVEIATDSNDSFVVHAVRASCAARKYAASGSSHQSGRASGSFELAPFVAVDC